MTDRNKFIIELLSKGITVKEIAKRLFINHRTLEAIIQNIRKENGCKNVAHLIGTMVDKDKPDFELRLSVMLAVRASHSEEYYKAFMKSRGMNEVSYRSLAVFKATQDCIEADLIIDIAKNQKHE